jgi:TonB family protein
MKPNRTHTIQNDNDETILIGEKIYERKRGGPWIKFDGITALIRAPESDINEEIKRIGQVKFIGAETLDGVSVLAYEYEHIDASGKRISGPYKIWISLKDGLAYKSESETQCQAEDWGGKPGDLGLITINVVTYFDWNAEINIELPEKAAREAAESWLKLVDSGRYSDSWAEAASVLKERYSEKPWEKRLNEFAEQASALSLIKSRDLRSIESVKSLPSNRNLKGVVLTYTVILEKTAPVVRGAYGDDRISQTLELVLDTDQVWRVANYTPVVKGEVGGYGPGSGGGMGVGKEGGMGPGNGRGVGPGSGYNMGGGDPRLSGGSGAPATSVDTRPIPLNSPQPRYTEKARNNKIEGSVTLRVLVGADGLVNQVRVVRGLPDGLDEQAIQAAYQLRFKPAMKAGKPVAYWLPVIVEFNLRRK